MSTYEPGWLCPHTRRALADYVTNPNFTADLSPTDKAVFYQSVVFCATGERPGFIPDMVITWIMQGLRGNRASVDPLVAAKLLDRDDTRAGYRLVGWSTDCDCQPPAAGTEPGHDQELSARRRWEADRKRRQRAARQGADVPGNVPANVPRDNVRDNVPVFSPPPKGAGGEKTKRGGADAPLRGGALARARDVSTPPTDRPASVPSDDQKTRENRQRPMGSEADWRAPRPAAAKPPDLGPVRAKLAEASAKYHDRPYRAKPLIGTDKGVEKAEPDGRNE